MDGDQVNLSKKERRELAKEERRSEREKQDNFLKIKKFAISLALLALVSFIGYKFVNFVNTPTSISLGQPLEIADNENIKGNSEANVVLVEYGDFQCPACATYHPTLKRLEEEYADSVKFVYRHLPLISIHPNAMPAAKAAEAANMQGKFWEMHDILFEKQEEWSGERNPKDKLVSYAQSLGLDIDRFNSDYDSREIQEKITGQMLTANRLGVSSTPTFFLNENTISPKSYEDFKSAIEEALIN